MAIIKVKKIKLKNLRNVRHGEVTLAVSFETFYKQMLLDYMDKMVLGRQP